MISDTHRRLLQQTARSLGQTEDEVMESALTLFVWAAAKVKEGNLIASIDEAKFLYKEASVPALERIKRDA